MIKFLQTPTTTKKVVLGGLLLIVCVTMVITLIPGITAGDFSGSGSRGTLARVGNQDVTTLEVQTMARNMGRQQFPKGFPPEFMPFLMQNAANGIILRKAMMVEAERMGLRVSDNELRDEMHQGPLGQQLFPNGQFIGQEQYENFLAQGFNMTPTQFEDAVKSDLLLRKLRGAIAAGVTVSDEDVQKEFQRQHSKVKLQYAVLSTEDIAKTVKATDAELKAFYDKSKARYENSIPEKRKAKYVVIDATKSRGQVQVTDADVQQYYSSHADEFKVDEQIKVAHILIKTPAPGPDGKVDENGVEEARKKAQDILNKLRAGADFAEMAKKESQDTGSAKVGGELGYYKHGQTVPEFDQAAFAQPVGKIGDLVKSQFGFHIIRVDEHQQPHTRPLAEVKQQITTNLTLQKNAAAVDAVATKVQSQAKTGGIDSAAAANGLNVVQSDWFGRNDTLPGVGPAPEFMNAAFQQQKNGPPDSVKLTNGNYVVVLITDVKPASTPAFEEIRAKVETDFKQQRAAELLQNKTQELADRAHAENDLKKAAKELGATVKTSDLVTPNDSVPDLGSMSAAQMEPAFALKKGDISGPVSTGAGGAIYQVLEKQEGTAEEFSKSKDEMRETLLDRKRNERVNLFVGDLRTRMEKAGKIKINQDEWKRVMNAREG